MITVPSLASRPAQHDLRTRPERPVRVQEQEAVRRSQPFVLALIALATLGSGWLNLYSLMAPAFPERVRLLREIFPLQFLHLSRFITLLIGFALIISSLNIYKRKRRAFQVVVLLATLSIFFHLFKGLDYEQALFSFGLLLSLIVTRNHFTVRSSEPSLRDGLLRLAMALGVGISYGIAGFWLLDRRHFGTDFSLLGSLHQTFAAFMLATNANLVPHTHYARWFLDSLQLMTVVSAGYAGIALFRPAVFALRTLPNERALARELVREYGRSALDYFKTWPDKTLFFSASNRCFLAYGVAANFALILGDPVGPNDGINDGSDEIGATVRSFMTLCEENDWGIGFYQTSPHFLSLYERLGFRKLKIGDDAIVDLESFTLEGHGMREFRGKIKQLEKEGIHSVFLEPPISERDLLEAKTVSDEWLRIPGRHERHFSLGMFQPQYVRSTSLFAAVNSEGRWLAFVNVIPSCVAGESTVDLMRRRTQAPNGIMDYLFVKLLSHLKTQGMKRFDFGMAPMSGFRESEDGSTEERAIHYFFQRLNFLFSFRGLRSYKAKFATSWEPRYAIYRNISDLPRLAIALAKLSKIGEED